MIVADLRDAPRYAGLHPSFEKLFKFVEETDFDTLPSGRIDLDGDNLYVVNSFAENVAKGERPLEMHRSYIDVQILLEGCELFGWKDRADIKSFSHPYSLENDCALSTEDPSFYVELRPGKFAIVWPEDAHAPLVGEGKVHKVIGKVKI